MCRNIKTLFNFDPPATDDEIRASALQFVRKLSGFNKPSQANAEAFDKAVRDVTDAARVLIASLSTTATPKDRGVEAEKLRQRSRYRACRVACRRRLRRASRYTAPARLTDSRRCSGAHWRQKRRPRSHREQTRS